MKTLTFGSMWYKLFHSTPPFQPFTITKRHLGSGLPGDYARELAALAKRAYSPFENLDKSKFHVDFYSSDYLGLGLNQELNQTHADAILRAGMDHNVSCVVSHPANSPVKDTELALARWLKSEAAVVTYSCATANIGVMEILLKGNDRPIYMDHYAHMTLKTALSVAEASSRLKLFRHNDMDHLRFRIEKAGSGVVAVDSIYSVNGEEAPMAELVELCRRLDCILVVDESHAVGVVGDAGEGLVAHLGLENGVHVRTASLSKALSCQNGVVASSKEVTDCYNSATTLALFSENVQTPSAVKVKKAIELAILATQQRDDLRNLSQSFQQQLKEAGYPVTGNANHPIVSLVVGDQERAMYTHNVLCSNGIFPMIFLYPATPRNEALMRFVINQHVTPEKVAYTVKTLKDLSQDLKPWTWAGKQRNKKQNIENSSNLE
ncbi:uncharacterized protein LOC106160305 [Lingula anatina]|uniref:Uncharacterized protein LOC106160305 n=1 Tax=Lingula anatina TaxID=7574 RepID=A0A1S3I215_LINAN|nr:uncharacterized protein LOC106160305 [Lingula anatina]|eukprot:XP_013392310.1 uncharacterized protein LOC106160305 [Lingula anatina]